MISMVFDYFQFDGLGGKSKCGTLSMQNHQCEIFHDFSLFFGLISMISDLKL